MRVCQSKRRDELSAVWEIVPALVIVRSNGAPPYSTLKGRSYEQGRRLPAQLSCCPCDSARTNGWMAAVLINTIENIKNKVVWTACIAKYTTQNAGRVRTKRMT